METTETGTIINNYIEVVNPGEKDHLTPEVVDNILNFEIIIVWVIGFLIFYKKTLKGSKNF